MCWLGHGAHKAEDPDDFSAAWMVRRAEALTAAGFDPIGVSSLMEKGVPHPFMRGLVAALATLALILAMDTLRLFGGEQWLSSLIGIETQYFYALLALLAPWVFITFPSKPWIDWPLAVTFVAILLVFFVTAEQALDEAGICRAGLCGVCLLGDVVDVAGSPASCSGLAALFDYGAFSILPVVTEFMPGPLNGTVDLSGNRVLSSAVH